MKRLVFLSVFVLASCGQNAVMTTNQSRQITVNGVGSATSVPDEFNFTVVIEEKGALASELNKIVSAKTEKVIQAMKGLRVDPEHIQSLQVQFNPWIEYQEQTQVQKGFILSRRINIGLDDLNSYDAAVDAVLQLKINRIEGFSYADSQAREHYQLAVGQALLDAKMRATHMAETLNLNLGKAISISEQSQGQPMQFEKVRTLRSSADSVSMPGEMSTQAQVSVVFELID